MQPASWLGTTILFGVPALAFAFLFHWVGPSLWHQGSSWWRIFHLLLILPLALMLAAALVGASVLTAPPSSAGPTVCDYPACTPGIMPHQVLGAPCDNTTYYAFGVTDGYVSFASEPGRLMFCGSPRRYQPRWFRSPPMAGIKDEGADCQNYQNYVAQAPDGLFLICFAHDGIMSWIRADT